MEIITLIYQELKSWQTVIGAVFGFIALMLGALYNFHLNRKRDAALRKEEMLSVAAALYGEIISLRNEIAFAGKIFARTVIEQGVLWWRIDEDFLASNALPEPTFYKVLADKIGLLDSDLILRIIAFHGAYSEVRKNFPLLLRNNETYKHSPLSVLLPTQHAVTDILPALRKIENMASIVEPAKVIDMEEMESAIKLVRT
jgi:hypothetical protein